MKKGIALVITAGTLLLGSLGCGSNTGRPYANTDTSPSPTFPQRTSMSR